MSTSLTVPDLAKGLESFGDSYNALDVFADDVYEVQLLKQGKLPKGWTQLAKGAFQISVGEETYYARLFDTEGVVRFSRSSDLPNNDNIAQGAILGGLAGAAIGAASSKKGEGLVGGLLLGLLVGAVLGGQLPNEPEAHRVFTLRFDPENRSWRTYNGALVRWMKSELAAA